MPGRSVRSSDPARPLLHPEVFLGKIEAFEVLFSSLILYPDAKSETDGDTKPLITAAYHEK
jgi:hypothetical protein